MDFLYSVEFQQFLRRLQEATKNTVAENTSSYSDIVILKLHPNSLRSSRRCVLAYLVKVCLGMNPIEEEQLKKQFAKIVDKYREQGEWKLLGELLELPTTPYPVFAKILATRSPEAFFGNDIKLIKSILRGLRVTSPYETKRKRIKVPSRKRGYDDKGSLRSTTKLPIEYWIKPKDSAERKINLTCQHFFTELSDRMKTAGYPGGEEYFIKAVVDEKGGILEWKLTLRRPLDS